LKENAAAPVWKTEITAVGILSADHATRLYPKNLVLISPTNGGRSVGIVRSGTKAKELLLLLLLLLLLSDHTASHPIRQ
jgi:hypothetical protein